VRFDIIRAVIQPIELGIVIDTEFRRLHFRVQCQPGQSQKFRVGFVDIDQACSLLSVGKTFHPHGGVFQRQTHAQCQ